MSVFFTDTACGLPPELIKKLGIEVINIPLDAAGKTKELTATEYVLAFEPALKAGQDILYVHFSAALSHSFASMNKAIEILKETYPQKITTADTKNVSMGAGLVVYEAAIRHRRGTSVSSIVKFVEKFSNEVGMFFALNSNAALTNTRFNKTEATTGGLLGVKSIFTVKNGDIENVGTEKGKNKVILTLVDKLKTLGENVADYPIIIVHSNCEADALELKQKVAEEVCKEAQIWLHPINETIRAYTGNGALGLVFHKKK